MPISVATWRTAPTLSPRTSTTKIQSWAPSGTSSPPGMGRITASGDARTTAPHCWSSTSRRSAGRASSPCIGPLMHRSIRFATAGGRSVVAGRYGGIHAMGAAVCTLGTGSGTSTTSSCMNHGTAAGSSAGSAARGGAGPVAGGGERAGASGVRTGPGGVVRRVRGSAAAALVCTRARAHGAAAAAHLRSIVAVQRWNRSRARDLRRRPRLCSCLFGDRWCRMRTCGD